MKDRGSGQLTYDRIRQLLTREGVRLHFIGIGGVSMYSLARLCMHLGASVSGSDREDSRRTAELFLLGAGIRIGHSAENVSDADLVVYSHAIPQDNPEMTEAVRRGIPILSRAELLGALMLDYKCRIGVSGSHGKSSVTAMLDTIFTHAGVDPTTLSGSDLPIGTPLRQGSRGTMIYEACEYRDSFLRFCPTIAIALNLELDHTDYFRDINALASSFTRALNKADSLAVIGGDDPILRGLVGKLHPRTVTFGSQEHNDYRYSITAFHKVGYDFTIYRMGSSIAALRLNIHGIYNVSNATAAVATALEYGLDIDTVREAIEGYRGISGRLEHIGYRYGRPVFYDYAHHPTEIRATLDALRSLVGGKITLVFKPHTYSRTLALWDDFCGALSLADNTVITDIFPARETAIEGVSSQALARAIDGAIYSPDQLVSETVDYLGDGAIILMGAGNFDKIKKDVLTKEIL